MRRPIRARQHIIIGTCWYRKSFTLPANVQKLFIEFEGAMQTATVYLNGNSDRESTSTAVIRPSSLISATHLVRGGNNVLAVSLNNVSSSDIPPGWANAGPDYYLYGGLNRSVWLHFKDSVYIPIYSAAGLDAECLGNERTAKGQGRR